jgi:hypothetical protein
MLVECICRQSHNMFLLLINDARSGEYVDIQATSPSAFDRLTNIANIRKHSEA